MLVLGGSAIFAGLRAPVGVETVTVGQAWPYQGLTVLNATGYVVAQRKAVVLGQVKAGSGKMYQVLAPTLAPQHLSLHDIELAIEMMVAAR